MEEEWRAVHGFPDVEVSNMGRVRSWTYGCRNGKRLKEPMFVAAVPVDQKRYYVVNLRDRKNKCGTTRSLAFLVASAFIEKVKQGQVIKYKDGDWHNCRADNLEVFSRQKQRRDHEKKAAERGDLQHGIRRPVAMIIKGRVAKTYPSTYEASLETGFDVGTIRRHARCETSRDVINGTDGVTFRFIKEAD